MITVLSVRQAERRRGLAGVLDRFRRDRAETELLRARGVSVKRVNLTTFRGKPSFDRAEKAVGAERRRILCAEVLSLPRDMGYKRFESPLFSSRICGNMFLAVLREAKHGASLRVGIYDPGAIATDILTGALECCCDVKAVTCRADRYALAARRALEDMGASSVITSRIDELSDRDFVLAPSNIAQPLPLGASCITLTVGEPRERAGGTVYTSYSFKMPKGFAELKPDELSEEYFCSALYTLGGQYELGSIVPLSCGNRIGTQTVASLAAALDSAVSSRYVFS